MGDERPDEVVLLTRDGHPCGAAPKHTVHSEQTPLHLGFSCHVLTSSGQILLTRRALHKRTWPGVWTNSFCGHPAPEEAVEDAVRRHARHELGLTVDGLEVVLPDFRYRATDASGVVEHEICPVVRATTNADPRPNPDEVAELTWTTPERLRAAVEAVPQVFSPWLVEQVAQMDLYQAGGAGAVPSTSGGAP
ncbi:isopentenyl-diphosphate Delta-isomerase [Nesterenkonia sp. F]|uniref:isopentenyl-diphosphate Delta-isomerase n=1 Tax=Nesterenkonia sp. F TaxID=795955 RepID=UPI000255CAE9|nr:isopentenyl-diphosphate Delta-isomerase [Nesterenkonia sp. F]